MQRVVLPGLLALGLFLPTPARCEGPARPKPGASNSAAPKVPAAGKAPANTPASTQASMIAEAAAELARVDAEMNRLNLVLSTRLKDKPAILDRVRKSQKEWSEFREFQIEALFPSLPGETGSLTPLLRHVESTELAEIRIRGLRRLMLVHGVEDPQSAPSPRK